MRPPPTCRGRASPRSSRSIGSARPGASWRLKSAGIPTTALDDLLHLPDGTINDSRLYRALDHLLPHKTALERHLTARYGELFAAEFDVLLYDLTSSYVEGAAPKNPMMRRGYSRDHRPDCLQVVLAVIVNVDGFPLSYETFDGNRADVTTLETVMRMVERKYGQARRVWVFDRGIVSDANLAAIRRRGGQYLVGTRRTTLRHVEQALLDGPWTQVRDEVEAQLIPIPGGTETYVLCRSTARREKELAIRRRFSTRLEDRLRALEKRVATGRLKDRAKSAHQPRSQRILPGRRFAHPRLRVTHIRISQFSPTGTLVQRTNR